MTIREANPDEVREIVERTVDGTITWIPSTVGHGLEWTLTGLGEYHRGEYRMIYRQGERLVAPDGKVLGELMSYLGLFNGDVVT